MKKFITLVQRELWEHTNLWRVPAILLVITALANLSFSGAASWLGIAPSNVSSGVVGGTLNSLGGVIFIVFSFLILFYLTDCLYSERKDKSILFWRSLPVSDTQSVLAKLFTAAVVIPVVIWLTIIAAHLVTLIVHSLIGGENTPRLFSLVDLGSIWRNQLVMLLLTALWTLPLMTWFLFCSSWSKRTPLLAAISIPLIIILLDRVFSLDIGLGQMIAERIPFGHRLIDATGGRQMLFGLLGMWSQQSQQLALSNFTVFFQQSALWGGLVVAAAITAATIWVRRWRDDS